jgi:hypothetical protein
MNILPEQSNFSANQNFPMGIGKGWERFLQEKQVFAQMP